MALFCAATRRDSVSLLKFSLGSHVHVFSLRFRQFVAWNIRISLLSLFYTFESFSHQHQLMVFLWILSDNKSPQVSRTFLCILAIFNNALVWMVSTRSLIFKSFCSFTNPLETVPIAPITISITVTFLFHSSFSSLARSQYLILFSLSFNFTLWSAGTAKSAIRQVFFFVDHY